jgi:hypothetical protein
VILIFVAHTLFTTVSNCKPKMNPTVTKTFWIVENVDKTAWVFWLDPKWGGSSISTTHTDSVWYATQAVNETYNFLWQSHTLENARTKWKDIILCGGKVIDTLYGKE